MSERNKVKRGKKKEREYKRDRNRKKKFASE